MQQPPTIEPGIDNVGINGQDVAIGGEGFLVTLHGSEGMAIVPPKIHLVRNLLQECLQFRESFGIGLGPHQGDRPAVASNG